MIVNFYETPSGRSPVEDFIISRSKADQARFAEVVVGLEEFGLSYSRVQFKPLRGKLWEIKFRKKLKIRILAKIIKKRGCPLFFILYPKLNIFRVSQPPHH